MKDILLQYQYSFEEICAKTIYNISDQGGLQHNDFMPPFDSDSPFWVVPIAVGFAHALGVRDMGRMSLLLRFEDENGVNGSA